MLSNIYELYQTDRIGIRVTDTYNWCVRNKIQDEEYQIHGTWKTGKPERFRARAVPVSCRRSASSAS